MPPVHHPLCEKRAPGALQKEPRHKDLVPNRPLTDNGRGSDAATGEKHRQLIEQIPARKVPAPPGETQARNWPGSGCWLMAAV